MKRLVLALALVACSPSKTRPTDGSAPVPTPSSPEPPSTTEPAPPPPPPAPPPPTGREPKKEGEACGGIAGFACAEGLDCDMNKGSCTQSDRMGTCSMHPEMCTQDMAPVCGCDKKTYSNDCERRQARQPLDHVGACK